MGGLVTPVALLLLDEFVDFDDHGLLVRSILNLLLRRKHLIDQVTVLKGSNARLLLDIVKGDLVLNDFGDLFADVVVFAHPLQKAGAVVLHRHLLEATVAVLNEWVTPSN